MPKRSIKPLESLLESLCRVLTLLIHLCDPSNSTNEDGFHPSRIFARNVALSLWVSLRAVTDANEAAVREPGVYLDHAIDFVVLRAVSEGGDEAT